VSEIVIKRAAAEDAEVIADLILEAFLPYKAEYTAGAFEYTTASAELIRSRLSEGPTWLAIDNGEPVGTVSGLVESDRFYIRSMAVKPAVQGRGIGQRLLESLEAYAKEEGFEKLYLYTTYVLPAARPLYEKNGFYIVRETRSEDWFDMPGIEMEKEI
jgi:GNAT superfamily N-acetyltransferase